MNYKEQLANYRKSYDYLEDWWKERETLKTRTHVSGYGHDPFLCERNGDQDTCGWYEIKYIERFHETTTS